jgi:hypothetical protein
VFALRYISWNVVYILNMPQKINKAQRNINVLMSSFHKPLENNIFLVLSAYLCLGLSNGFFL